MSSYKTLLKPLLKDVEGFSENVYEDTKGNPTTGYGFNLNDEEVVGLMGVHGLNKDRMIAGEQTISQQQAEAIKDAIINRKEELVRNSVGSDLYDNLSDNKKAALISLGYNSMNLLGPKIRQNIADNDDLLAAKEILLNSNPKKELGVLRRRTDEAKTYLGDEQYNKLNMLLSDEEKQQLQNILDKSDNENVKNEYLNSHGNILKKVNAPKPLTFDKLFETIPTPIKGR